MSLFRITSLLCWSALAVLAGSSVVAQESVESAEQEAIEEESVYIETVDVNVINVEVYVTDKKGNPITGLTRDDFEVMEDKRPVAITNFYAVTEGQRTAAAIEEAPPAPLETEERPKSRAEPVLADDQQLSLVVYVDNFNIRPFNRNRVFRRLREFLTDKLQRGDRVMLVSYDRTLNFRHPFTTDPQLIASATFELEKVTGHAVHIDSERRRILEAISEAQNPQEVAWQVRQFAESGFNDLSFSTDALNDIVDSLGGLPGRKALLYVSDGLPMTPGEDLFYALTYRFQTQSQLTELREFDASRRFEELASQANSNRVTFYTIDAAGLRAPTSSSVEYNASTEQAGMSGFVDSVNIQNLQGTLRMLAEKTGGQAILNTNDIGDSLTKVASDFRSYYSIGYTPSHSGTGRYYKINVKVKDRKGLRVRHRVGYRDKPLMARMSDSARSALLYGLEDNPLNVVLRLGDPEPADEDLYDLPILVGIPLDSIVLIPVSDSHEARVKLYFSAMDEKEKMSDVQEVTVPIRIANADLTDSEGKYFPYQTALRMRSGGHRLTVGVFDELSAVSSFVSKAVIVGRN